MKVKVENVRQAGYEVVPSKAQGIGDNQYEAIDTS